MQLDLFLMLPLMMFIFCVALFCIFMRVSYSRARMQRTLSADMPVHTQMAPSFDHDDDDDRDRFGHSSTFSSRDSDSDRSESRHSISHGSGISRGFGGHGSSTSHRPTSGKREGPRPSHTSRPSMGKSSSFSHRPSHGSRPGPSGSSRSGTGGSHHGLRKKSDRR